MPTPSSAAYHSPKSSPRPTVQRTVDAAEVTDGTVCGNAAQSIRSCEEWRGRMRADAEDMGASDERKLAVVVVRTRRPRASSFHLATGR